MSTLSLFKDEVAIARPRTADGELQRPAMLKRPTLGSRNVSFTPGVRVAPTATRPEHHRLHSDYSALETQQSGWRGEVHMQRIDRHAQNVDPDLEPALPFAPESRDSPFLIYDDSFAHLLGDDPTLENIISDNRGPFFYSGGAYLASISTCFLTSNLLQDPDPWMAVSGNRRVEITKLEFTGSQKVNRDKVRCSEKSYMASGIAVHPRTENPTLIICTQGSLNEAAGLVSIDAKRPHKSRMILNNFHGKPFNSPSELVSNPVDNAVYFMDPASGYERGFRPRPKLPSGHVYRFHPATGDCRVVVSGLQRPVGLALSPDYSRLYVSELADKYDGLYVHAYDLTYTDSPKVPTFNISVIPGIKHKASGSSGSASGSSSQAAPPYYQGHSYPTPDSSPQSRTAALLGRPVSRTRSTSHNRSLELGNHKILASMAGGLRSPSRGPTSEPTSTDAGFTFATPFPYPKRKRGTSLSPKRLVIYSPNVVPSGAITTDPVQGHIWLGTEDGVEIWNAETGELIGKILVDESDSRRADGQRKRMRGVSKVVFTNDGEALLLGGERIWRLRMGHRGG